MNCKRNSEFERKGKDRRRMCGLKEMGNKEERGVRVNKWPSFTFTPSDGYLS